MSKVEPFLKTGTQAIASYNYTDIDEQTGTVEYYPFATQSPTTDYGATKNTLYSNPSYTETTIAEGTGTIDVDFDILMNTPKTINGDVIVNVPIYAQSSIDQGASFSIVANIYKVVDAVETSLGTGTSDYILNAGANHEQNEVTAIKINVDNEHLSQDETLRLNIIGTIQRIDGSCTGGFRHDPAARTQVTAATQDDYETSKAIFAIPYKLDI